MEEQTLCTLLRLCHILSTYPIVCLAAGLTYSFLLGFELSGGDFGFRAVGF